MRALCCVLLISAVAAAAHADRDARLDARVDRNFHSVQVCELLPQLTHDTGVQLRADPDIKDFMLFLCVKDRPLSEVMAHTAKALGAEWVRAGSSYTFRLTKARCHELERTVDEAAQAPIEVIRETVSRAKTLLAMDALARANIIREWRSHGELYRPDGCPTAAELCRQLGLRPCRLAIRILATWTDADWRELAREGAITYSTSPTPAQRHLPKWYLNEAKLWQAEVKARWKADLSAGAPSKRYRESSDPSPAFGPSAPAALRIWFDYDADRGLQIRMYLQDKDRQPLVESQAWIIGGRCTPSKRPAVPTALKGWPFDQPYTVPKSVADFVTAYHQNDDQVPDMETQAEFVEPIDVATGAVLTDIADKTKMSFATPLIDLMADPRLSFDSPCPLGEFLFWSQGGYLAMQYEAGGGWITGCVLSDPYHDFLGPCLPRRVLRDFHGILRTGKVPSLDWYAAAIGGMSPEQIAVITTCPVVPIHTLNLSGLRFNERPDFMRFWLALTPEHKRLAIASKDIPFSAMSRAERSALATYVRRDTDHDTDWSEFAPGDGLDNAVFTTTYDAGSYFLQYLSPGERPPKPPSTRYIEPCSAMQLYMAVNLNRGTDRPVVYRGDWWRARFVIEIKPRRSSVIFLTASRLDSYTPVDPKSPDAALAAFVEQGRQEYERRAREYSK